MEDPRDLQFFFEFFLVTTGQNSVPASIAFFYLNPSSLFPPFSSSLLVAVLVVDPQLSVVGVVLKNFRKLLHHPRDDISDVSYDVLGVWLRMRRILTHLRDSAAQVRIRDRASHGARLGE